MENRENKNETDVNELLANTEEVSKKNEIQNSNGDKISDDTARENKIFQKFKIKDIVFLAIMAAVMLVTGSIMPLVGQIPLFGIIQLCLGLQFSIFPTIGLMKVRKPGSLLFISIFCGILLVFMNTVMFATMVICSLIAEGLTLLIFRGYKKDGACLFAGTVYFPMTLPFLYIWYKYLYVFKGDEGEAVNAFIGSELYVALLISLAVIAVCFVGALIGMLISRELKKSGVIKK